MILTDYYKCIELKPIKSRRLDCVASTGGYIPFEAIAKTSKCGRFFCYLSDEQPRTFKRDGKSRDAGKVITNGKSISSVYTPDITLNPYLGYGDTRGTDDALLFKFSPDFKGMEVFVARGQKYNKLPLYNLFSGGELNEEMQSLRDRAERVNF